MAPVARGDGACPPIATPEVFMPAVERAIFCIPTDLDDWIVGFRREHDGLNGLPAYIELVSSFSSSLPATILHHHLASVAVSCRGFELTFGPAEVGPDGLVRLSIVEGTKRCECLRDSLYSGPLTAFAPDVEFRPSLVLARVPSDDVASVTARAHEHGGAAGRIEMLLVQVTDRHGDSEIETELDLA